MYLYTLQKKATKIVRRENSVFISVNFLSFYDLILYRSCLAYTDLFVCYDLIYKYNMYVIVIYTTFINNFIGIYYNTD